MKKDPIIQIVKITQIIILFLKSVPISVLKKNFYNKSVKIFYRNLLI
ncbi:Uncharacterised protein [Legionella busanensis]|uniref:Uncharacterized protein n=1 Tax=Legionella busanensis TaxID=190655 RepID=A0A378JNJ2_9GAMM|nr:Uncharacterised protein [Legionella busanensis]